RVQESLEMVHLSGANQKYPSELSGGMQKRIGLARALVTRPKVILYDEPEAGLAPGMSQSISDLIRRLQQEYAMTILVVTHSQDCARATADRMAVFEAGRFLAEGAPDDVLNSDHPRVRNFLGSPLRNS
ncbi:MAG: ATP-binding cassette domain-containing protein, partial [Planctomycetes bacterium]|nr:ATP-binding cassette domain-containing protein [Planctomycetota bacterium]